jgi:hypothetical protein
MECICFRANTCITVRNGKTQLDGIAGFGDQLFIDRIARETRAGSDGNDANYAIKKK